MLSDMTSRRGPRRPHRACSATLVAALLLSVAGTASAAKVLTGRDRAHGAQFSLSGRTLTVTYRTAAGARGFAGHLVRAECVQPLSEGDGPARTLRWRARSRRLELRLPSSPGFAPVFCSVITASRRVPIASIAATLQ
jgi:hypothetical protein